MFYSLCYSEPWVTNIITQNDSLTTTALMWPLLSARLQFQTGMKGSRQCIPPGNVRLIMSNMKQHLDVQLPALCSGGAFSIQDHTGCLHRWEMCHTFLLLYIKTFARLLPLPSLPLRSRWIDLSRTTRKAGDENYQRSLRVSRFAFWLLSSAPELQKAHPHTGIPTPHLRFKPLIFQFSKTTSENPQRASLSGFSAALLCGQVKRLGKQERSKNKLEGRRSFSLRH